MEIILYLSQSENDAIVLQEGDITNDDPKAFVESLKDLMKQWLIDVSLVELINDDDYLRVMRGYLYQLQQLGVGKQQAISDLASLLIQVYGETD